MKEEAAKMVGLTKTPVKISNDSLSGHISKLQVSFLSALTLRSSGCRRDKDSFANH